MGKVGAQLLGQDPTAQVARWVGGKLDRVERGRLQLVAATELPIGMQHVARRGAAPWLIAPAEVLRHTIERRPSRFACQQWWPQ